MINQTSISSYIPESCKWSESVRKSYINKSQLQTPDFTNWFFKKNIVINFDRVH